MKRHKNFFHRILCSLAFFFCTVLVSSCATSPKAGTAQTDGVPDFSVLPPGGNVYLWADVGRARPLLEALSFNGMSGKDASQILDRTKTAVAALYPADPNAPASSGNTRTFFLAGWGRYPVFGAGISMGFSRSWKKKKSPGGNRYWYSESYRIGTVLGSRIAFVSDADPFAQSSTADPAPFGFEEFRKGTVLSGWHNDAGVQINNIVESMGLPITVPVDMLFFGFVLAAQEAGRPEKYETVLRVKTPSGSQAAAIAAALSIARMVLGFEGEEPGSLIEILLSSAPVRDGQDILLRLPPMSAPEIARFLSMDTFFD